MNLKELKAGIVSLMKSKYPSDKYKYYQKVVFEGYTRPSFSLKLTPISVTSQTTNVLEKSYALNITYFQPILDEEDMLDKIDGIQELFGNYIKIGDRAVDVTDYDYEYLGTDRNIIEISVSLEWFDRIINADDQPVMDDLDLTTKLETEE